MNLLLTSDPKISSHRASAFSLVELLVSMAVLSLLLAISIQVVNLASSTIQTADQQRGASGQARVTLDRFAADFSTAMLKAGSSAIVSEGTPDTFIRFLCLSRSRKTAAGGIPRAAVVGYGINPDDPFPEIINGQEISYYPLMRGDGRITIADTLSTVFSRLSQSTPAAIIPNDQWEILGSGIIRFHISYVLDNGAIVQTPPEYEMTSPQTGDRIGFLNGLPLGSDFRAVAFSPENAPSTGTLAGRYVKSLIVGVAAVDPSALLRSSGAEALAMSSSLGSPTDGETPLAVWQERLEDPGFNPPQPLRESLRFYQRTVAVP